MKRYENNKERIRIEKTIVKFVENLGEESLLLGMRTWDAVVEFVAVVVWGTVRVGFALAELKLLLLSKARLGTAYANSELAAMTSLLRTAVLELLAFLYFWRYNSNANSKLSTSSDSTVFMAFAFLNRIILGCNEIFGYASVFHCTNETLRTVAKLFIFVHGRLTSFELIEIFRRINTPSKLVTILVS